MLPRRTITMLNRLACLRLTSRLLNVPWAAVQSGQNVESVLPAVFSRTFHEDFLDKRIKDRIKRNPFDEPNAGELSQDLDRELKRRQVSKKKAIIGRKYGFKPKGAQPRLLTWDAIEHIYFLRAEYPKEWPLQRLAEGFGVDVDMIIRVLKSKHRPLSSEKRALHDQQALANRRQLGLPALPPIQPEQRIRKALPQQLKTVLPQTNLKMLSPVQKEMVHHLGQMKQRLEQRYQRAITAEPGTEESNVVEIELRKHEPQHLEDVVKGTWKPQQGSKSSRSGHNVQPVAGRADSGGDDDGYMVEDIDLDLIQERFEDIMEKYPNVDDEEVVEKDGQFFTKDGDFLYKV
ncbi:hypothetical protein Bbelb_408770 [Branchiostoma belcheri]|nr:hypothetical protein Bbelb_408770 [Branchiostoma belcheri]